jgi:hypothetical protein
MFFLASNDFSLPCLLFRPKRTTFIKNVFDKLDIKFFLLLNQRRNSDIAVVFTQSSLLLTMMIIMTGSRKRDFQGFAKR